ncbi:MAG: chlorophyllide a reductase iron protein subunit X [Chlorobiales bacterium]|jgi:3,8-divinyl chlorophyllide a/chlorophyllide a reductase subunit X|nr:chlorophyllide a reductase iron protein subunit X [Chlorobiales bacterium]
MPARTIAIYGKGGIGKSFITTNLSATFSLMQKRVLQLGCDPKHDSTTSLFGGISLPTVTEVFGEKTQSNEKVRVEDIVFKRKLPGFPEDIFGIELGGPDVGRGCGGRGIISGFDVLEKLGLFKWEIDLILMDFLGDVVCGGFATPLARSLCQDVILVVSNDRQSIFAANNICTANNHFKTVGGSSRLLGLIVNRDDGSGIAERYAKAAGINVLMKLPYSSAARDKSDSFDVAIRLSEIYAPFQNLAERIWEEKIEPCESRGLSYKEFMDLFGEVDVRIPEPATIEDLHLDKNLDLDARDLIKSASSTHAADALPVEEEFVSTPRTNGIADETEKLSEKSATKHLSDQEKLIHCISLLPPTQKDVLTLFEIKKKTIDEIAIERQLERTEVAALLSAAREAVRQLFFQAE